MIRHLAALVLIMLATELPAETIPVRSGEHEGFSRVVVQLPGSGNWAFGRVQGGYELRVDRPDTRFDVTGIFDKIPRTRLVRVEAPGDGRLYLALGCDCSGDAFELSRGRLVIDIKDDPPVPGSRFEAVLPDVVEVGTVTVSPGPTRREHGMPLRPRSAAAKETATMLRFSQDTDRPRDVLFPLGTREGTIVKSLAENRPFEASNVFTGAVSRERDQPESNISSPLPMVDPDPMPVFRPKKTAVHAAPGNKGNRDIWRADRQADLFLKNYQPGSQVVAETQAALLREFGRAATQGILEIRAPVIDRPQVQPADAVEESTNKTEPTRIGPPNQPGKSTHLKIETVLDRDNALIELKNKLSSDGQNCLPGALFDVASWGPRTPGKSPFGFLRAGVVREFDKPDIQAVTDLAHRYIYLGFGAEAKALLNAFDIPVDNRDILVQLSEILDYGAVRSSGPLQRQISCATDAAIWAVLANTIPRGADIDKRAVLRSFSSWPRHLRDLLGPDLATRFLNNDDIETATAVRNIIDRTLGERSAGFEILNAQIEDSQGDTAQAIRALETVAAKGGPLEAEAVAELLEAKLENDDPIRESTALLADSLSFEYRGTKTGKRLARAAIMGFARAGKISATFDRIDAALEHGDLTTGEATELQFDAHLANALRSSDAEFLAEFFRRGFDQSTSSNAMKMARRAVAKRLTNLGFAGTALDLYGKSPAKAGDLVVADRAILANVYLAVQTPQKALDILVADHGTKIDELRARAYEMEQAFDKAAGLYAKLDMRPEEESAAWRGRDFAAARKVGSGAIKRAAEIAMQSAIPQPPAGSAQNSTTKQRGLQEDFQDGEPQTLAQAREILSESSAVRDVMGELLGF